MNSNSNNLRDLQSDIVCIGAGGAGLAAAVAAAEKGAKVIVLEKRNSPGGNTARAQGFFSAESETQKRLKIKAPKDTLFKQAMSYSHWKINPRIIRAFIDKSTDTLKWLNKQGLEVNEVWSLFPDQAIPTMHFPVGGGEGIIKVLVNSCEKLGVRIFYNTSPQKILTAGNGKVSGVQVKIEGKEVQIAARSIVIGTGGYGGNKELLKKYCPSYTEDILSPGCPNMGEGISMAVEAGADTEGLGTLMWLGPVL
jgi:fumarate reductase flavoprotein subunit